MICKLVMCSIWELLFFSSFYARMIRYRSCIVELILKFMKLMYFLWYCFILLVVISLIEVCDCGLSVKVMFCKIKVCFAIGSKSRFRAFAFATKKIFLMYYNWIMLF